MFDRMHRLRRGAVDRRRRRSLAVVVLASCGGTGNDNDQNSLRSGRPGRQTRSSTCSRRSSGSRSSSASASSAARSSSRCGSGRSPAKSAARSRCTATPCSRSSWTIIPALILMVMAVFTIPVDLRPGREADRRRRRAHHGHRPPVVLGVRRTPTTSFVTANEMHIPVGRPDQHGRSPSALPNGVIHSFWVPELNGKKDVVPGRDALPEVRGRQARHLPRAVRRVLRPLARRHARCA